ncbi:hypothetical protein HR080_07940 [Staphylococcus schleiferi subsp. coagulans]|uniref:hypothetical protein n=1 Tax=Staphylococcus coagulans TaxID=74706 RepID=UPI0015F98B52|nr:hypothetical protein [Staphylococcus coagulans]MBA8779268.1 hypothetical protein [Staphylococcus coagulans]
MKKRILTLLFFISYMIFVYIVLFVLLPALHITAHWQTQGVTVLLFFLGLFLGIRIRRRFLE